MAPERNPASTGYALKQLYLIKDAMLRHSFNEAIQRCADVLVHIENETDWCYNTDSVLPFMRAFFMELSELNLRLVQCTQKSVSAQVKEAVTTLENVSNELTKNRYDENLMPTPEKPDDIERITHVSKHL